MVQTATTLRDWRDKFIEKVRTPRPGHDDIRLLLLRAMDMQVSLRQKRDHRHIEGRAYKRNYVTLRVPESVVERVHRKMSLVNNS